MSKFHLAFLTVAISVFSVLNASAHEYWIETTATDYAPGDAISADIRVGEMMRGSALPYSDQRVRLVAGQTPESPLAVATRLGDRPAITVSDTTDGLHVFGLETSATTLKYQKFDKFSSFVRSHGQDFAIARHRERNLPDTGFREAYFRFSKSLAKVGDGSGADWQFGFPLELTALDNPYTTDGPIRVQLTFQRTPLANHHIDIFHRPFGETGDADKTVAQSDADGVITIDLQPGRYLINAVKLEEPGERMAEQLDVVWVSLWASTTFWKD